MLPTKFRVNWPFGSGEDAINRFSMAPVWISDRNSLALFILQTIPKLPIWVRVSWPFGSGKEVKNRFSRRPPSWISDWIDLNYFLSISQSDDSYQVSSQLAFRFRRGSKK